MLNLRRGHRLVRVLPVAAITLTMTLAGGVPQASAKIEPLLGAPSAVRPLAMTKAKPARAVTVSTKTSATAMISGSRIPLTGTARGALKGTSTVLQRLVGTKWVTVSTTRLDARLNYRFAFVPVAGAPRYRVVVPARTGRRAGFGKTITFRVEVCTPSAAPKVPAVAWFTRPGLKTTSPISTNLGKLFCTAAPGSSIHIAMYFITNGSREVEPMLRALTRVHRYRGVKVQFVLEGKHYDSVWGRDSLKRLRSIGTVSLCQWSCRSDRGNSGVQHQKFIVMSDTTMRAGVDPVLVSSSGNWSHGQLRGMWQSAQTFYSDPALAREFDIRFTSMQACVTKGGCSSWNRRYAGKLLPASTYGLVNKRSVWTDASSAPRAGSAGRGTSVLLSPMPAGPDPLLSQLDRYSCSAAHRSVRIAMLKVQTERTAQIAGTVKALRARGCQVQLLFSTPADTVATKGLAALSAKGIGFQCVAGLHEKAVLMDGVDRATGKARTTLWAGSQNLTVSAVSYNDDASVRLVLQDAGASHAAALGAVWRAYQTSWTAMSKVPVSCSTTAVLPNLSGEPEPIEEPLLGWDG